MGIFTFFLDFQAKYPSSYLRLPGIPSLLVRSGSRWSPLSRRSYWSRLISRRLPSGVALVKLWEVSCYMPRLSTLVPPWCKYTYPSVVFFAGLTLGVSSPFYRLFPLSLVVIMSESPVTRKTPSRWSHLSLPSL